MSTSSFSDSFDTLADASFTLENLDSSEHHSSHVNMIHISNPSSAASSVPNTDEEEEDDKKQSYKERRREAHTQAEKKRREAIRKGYNDLQLLVPNCNQQQSDMVGSQKVSKAVVLQRSLDYIEFLQKDNKRQADELNKLKKEKIALEIMKSSYEQIVQQHHTSTGNVQSKLTEEVKFAVFQQIMEKLFITFDAKVSASSFQELSSCVINWIEEQCKPQNFHTAVNEVLTHLNVNNHHC